MSFDPRKAKYEERRRLVVALPRHNMRRGAVGYVLSESPISQMVTIEFTKGPLTVRADQLEPHVCQVCEGPLPDTNPTCGACREKYASAQDEVDADDVAFVESLP